MKRDEILRVIKDLSYSKGFYGRLLRDLKDDPVMADEFFNKLEELNLKNSLDVVLAIEG